MITELGWSMKSLYDCEFKIRFPAAPITIEPALQFEAGRLTSALITTSSSPSGIPSVSEPETDHGEPGLPNAVFQSPVELAVKVA